MDADTLRMLAGFAMIVVLLALAVHAMNGWD